MRIAQVAPLYESVPPKLYGGTERVVSYLTEELVRQGHRVTLFASGDSHTAAKLVAGCEHALRLEGGQTAAIALHTLLGEAVFAHADSFDVIHCHIDSIHMPLARRCPVPVITTLHGRLDIAGLERLHREFSELPLVSISDAQRAPLPWASWAGTVHHGLPLELHRPHYDAGRYLVFLGRISPEKGVDRAIAIARQAGLPLKIAAKVDAVDREYFAAEIEPQLAAPGVEYLGEVDESAKTELLGGALALLFPIDWPEPFGLTMIEAMACGTPAIAFARARFRRSSIPASRATSLPASMRLQPASRVRATSTADSADGSSSAASVPPAWRRNTAPFIEIARRVGVGGEREHGGKRVLHPGARGADAGAHLRTEARRGYLLHGLGRAHGRRPLGALQPDGVLQRLDLAAPQRADRRRPLGLSLQGSGSQDSLGSVGRRLGRSHPVPLLRCG